MTSLKQYFNSCTLYILLWILYSLQGTLYAEGSFISQGTLAIIILISTFFFIKVNFSSWKLPSFLKALNVFIVMMTIYGFVALFDVSLSIKGATVLQYEVLKTLYMSLLPIYVMFYYSRKQVLNENVIKVVSVFLIISAIVSFYQYQAATLAKAAFEGSTREEFTNNTSYVFLQLMPLMFFWRRTPVIQMLLTAVICVFIVMGLKRGAMAIGAICLCWLFYRILKQSKNWSRFAVIIIIIGGVYFGVQKLVEFYNASDYFQQRMEQTMEGDSSGRDEIFEKLWLHYDSDPSFVHQFFGNGSYATIEIVGNYAHNDWLELLICQGVLGVIVYAFYFLSFIKNIHQARYQPVIYSILIMTFIIMFVSTFFSMSYNSLNLSIAISLGYGLSELQQETKQV